jgi:hypothetical protein
MVAGAGRFGLAMDGMETEGEGDGYEHQDGHGDAQPLDRRAFVGEGAGGEIERNPHG